MTVHIGLQIDNDGRVLAIQRRDASHEVLNVAKSKEKVLVHYFKVAVEQPLEESNKDGATDALESVSGVIGVEFLRTSVKTKVEE